MQEVIIVGSRQEQVKFSELTLDMFRMLQTMEREAQEDMPQVYDVSPGQGRAPFVSTVRSSAIWSPEIWSNRLYGQVSLVVLPTVAVFSGKMCLGKFPTPLSGLLSRSDDERPFMGRMKGTDYMRARRARRGEGELRA